MSAALRPNVKQPRKRRLRNRPECERKPRSSSASKRSAEPQAEETATLEQQRRAQADADRAAAEPLATLPQAGASRGRESKG